MATRVSLHHARPSEAGFILPLTLWIVAILGLGIAGINAWVSTAVENSRLLQHRAETDLAVANLRNELVYLLATRPLTYRGLEVGQGLKRPDRFDFTSVMSATYDSSEAISFDNRPYVLESNPDFLVQIQDSRGLINLNSITGLYLRRFFSEFHVPGNYRDRLIDTLADWIDDDNLSNQSGAERDTYERLGRLGPTNTPMLTPFEAQGILDWDTIPQIWEADRKTPLFTACAAGAFNPNTAPESVMMAYVIGLTQENLAEVMRRRAEKPFRNQYEFAQVSDVLTPNEAFFFAFLPANCMIVNVTDRSTGERVRFSFSILPYSRHQPWQVDYAFRIPPQERDELDRANPEITFPSPETVHLREQRDSAAERVD